MRAWLGIAILAGVVLAVSYRVTLNGIPRARMDALMGEIIQQAGGVNRIVHTDLEGENTPGFLLPAPDLLYSACVYDLKFGPVRVAGHVPEAYWSLSLHSKAAENFYLANDREVAGPRYDVVVALNGQHVPPDVAPDHVVRAPTRRGVALVRIFVPDATVLPTLRAVQREGRCAPAQ